MFCSGENSVVLQISEPYLCYDLDDNGYLNQSEIELAIKSGAGLELFSHALIELGQSEEKIVDVFLQFSESDRYSIILNTQDCLAGDMFLIELEVTMDGGNIMTTAVEDAMNIYIDILERMERSGKCVFETYQP